ncbi:sporulation killing factor system radical SAM maturase [Amycolatopsis sp. NPDC059027]|uniref:sporulation killing factor system radical SAM maturase n=1 Tax=Amycolatopsis sp. NPDC059027 TaxID=3346709 RepID=UPI00366CED9E
MGVVVDDAGADLGHDAGKRDDPVVWGIHLQPNGGIFVDRQSLYYVRMSGLALELALQMARAGSVAAVARLRSHLDNEPVETARRYIERLLGAHPVTESWLAGELRGGVKVSGSTAAYLPLNATLQLTNRCNLRCSFCYAGSGDPMPAELCAGEWTAVLERLAEAGTAAVTLTGGEPTIAAEFPRILAVASALIDNVDIFTNGLAWSDRLIEYVASCGNVRAQVSIDGRAEHHDLLRGRAGSYRRALSTIERLSSAGVPVFVAMTVSPANHGDVEPVIEDVAAAGALLFRAGATVPVGRGTDAGFVLTKDQVNAVVKQFTRVNERDLGIDVVGWDRCADPDQEFAGAGVPVEFLTPGYLSWYIRADGKVTPCQVEETAFGDVRAEPFGRIGDPARLAVIRGEATDCACVRNLRIDEEADVPFGLSARWPAAGTSCCAGREGCCG